MPKPDADPASDVQLQIRMPLALHDRLRRKATKERRSMSSEARALIAAGLKTPRKPAAKSKEPVTP
jgi:plasmid stability protein